MGAGCSSDGGDELQHDSQHGYHKRKPYLVGSSTQGGGHSSGNHGGGGGSGAPSELNSANHPSSNAALVRGPTAINFELTGSIGGGGGTATSSSSASPKVQTKNLSLLASSSSVASTAEPTSSPSPHQSPTRVHRSRSNVDVLAGSPLSAHLTVGGTTTPHRGSFNRSLQLSSSPPRAGFGTTLPPAPGSERAPSPSPRNQTPPPSGGPNPRFLSTLALPSSTATCTPAPQLTRSVSAQHPGSSPPLAAANRAFTPTLDLDTLMAMGSPDLPRASAPHSNGGRSSSAAGASASIPIVQRRSSRSDLRGNQPLHMNGAFSSPKFGATGAGTTVTAAGLPDTGSSPPPSFYRSQSALGFSLSSREALRASGSGLGLPGANGSSDGPNLGLYTSGHNLAPGPGQNVNRYSASTSLPNASFFQQAQAMAAAQQQQQSGGSSSNLLLLQPSATQQASSFARQSGSSFSTQVSPSFPSAQQQQQSTSLLPQQQQLPSSAHPALSGTSRFRERMGLGNSPVVSPMNGPRRYSFSERQAPSLALTAPPLTGGGGNGGSPHLHSLRESDADSPRTGTGSVVGASFLQLDLSSPGSGGSNSIPTSPAAASVGYLPYPDPAASAAAGGSPGKGRQLLRTGTTLSRRFSLTSASQLTNAVSNAHSSMFAHAQGNSSGGAAVPGSSPAAAANAASSVERDLLRGSGVFDQMLLGSSPTAAKAFLLHLPTRAAPGYHNSAEGRGSGSGHGLPYLPHLPAAPAASSLSSSTPLPGCSSTVSSASTGSPASTMSFPSPMGSDDHASHFSSHSSSHTHNLSSASTSAASSAASSTSHSKQPSSIHSPLAPLGLPSMPMRRSATEGDVNSLAISGQHHSHSHHSHHHAAEGSIASSGLGRPTSLGAPSTSVSAAAAASINGGGSTPFPLHAIKLRKSFSHHADPDPAVPLPAEVEA